MSKLFQGFDKLRNLFRAGFPDRVEIYLPVCMRDDMAKRYPTMNCRESLHYRVVSGTNRAECFANTLQLQENGGLEQYIAIKVIP
jgi:hypothetical protein